MRLLLADPEAVDPPTVDLYLGHVGSFAPAADPAFTYRLPTIPRPVVSPLRQMIARKNGV